MQEQKSTENRLKSPFYKLVTGNLSIQIVVTVLAVLLYAVLSQFIAERLAAGITTLILLPLYAVMIYTFAWGAAERERNMVLYGHMQEDLGRGLRSGLYAALPVFCFSLLVLILAYAGKGANLIGIYRMCTAPFIWFVNPMIEYTPFLLPLTAFVSPLFSWWGYRNGHRLYRVWDHLIYKDGIKTKNGSRNRDGVRARKH